MDRRRRHSAGPGVVRFYDPTTGQFLTRDPITSLTREPYGYVYGNPLNNTDPSGLYCMTGVAGHDANGDEICNGAGEVASNAGHFVVEHRDVIATAAAAGVCLSGVGTLACGLATAGALGVRAQKRIADQGFSESLGANIADTTVTAATFGLVSVPSGIAEGGATLLPGVGGEAAQSVTGLAADGAPWWQIAGLRIGAATPDLAGIAGEVLATDCRESRL